MVLSGMPGEQSALQLQGRRAECAQLDRVLEGARANRSSVLVVRGESGVGKSVLLDYVSARASGCRVARAGGVESEMELPLAGLQQLLGASMLQRVEHLPPPQRDALRLAFGLSEGPAPDRFLLGLAALSLLSEVADERPLLCVVDDVQWLDRESAQVLSFVARRLEAEPIGMVFAVREPSAVPELAGLPELVVEGLEEHDARVLLTSGFPGGLDEQVRDRIVAETRGNPLALLELPRGLTATELAGGFGVSVAHGLPGRIEESFLRRLETLPEDTRLLLLVAAAEPVGDPLLMWRAAEALGVGASAVASAEDDDLLTVGGRVTFRHPLVRSAVYRAAPDRDRRAVHLALAEATDREADPDRRAWHLAAAAYGPDEDVALELERSAGRAQGRGGVAAAAAFLQRAVGLTGDPARRTERALAAAETSFQAGELDKAQRLLSTVEFDPLDGLHAARAALLRGHVAMVVRYGDDAGLLLLEAARQLEAFDLELARETYLIAYGSAMAAGHLGQAGVFLDICQAIKDLPPPSEATDAKSLLLEGLARMHTDGRAAAIPILQRAAIAVADLPEQDVLRWGWIAPMASNVTWNSDGATAIYERQAKIVRDAGALAELPVYLSSLALDRVWTGDLLGARLLIAESDAVAAAAGSNLPPFAALRLWSMEGSEAQASPLIAATIEEATARGQGNAVRVAQWAAAVLYNGLAQYEEAAAAARSVTANDIDPYPWMWVLPELVEAATRVGERDVARNALGRLAETTQPAGTDCALGMEARSRALLSDGEAADLLYSEAIERLGRTTLRPELARAHLLYGEWLRRENRRVDARVHLHQAHDLFTAIGMEAFAERARIELGATGETVRKRTTETRDELTAQERQIAQLAREGLSNPEIGARMFLSPRTVEWHLGKVFTKLGIRSRRELPSTLPSSDSELIPS